MNTDRLRQGRSLSLVRRLSILAVLMALATALLLPARADAHSGEESYVYLDILDDRIEGRIEFPVIDVNEILGLNLRTGGEELKADIAANLPALQAYAAEHFAMGENESLNWTISYDGFDMLDASNGSYVVLPFEVEDRFASVPRQFEAFYDGIIHAKSNRSAFLLIATDWGSGTFANEADALLTFNSGTSEHTVDLDDSSWWRGFKTVVVLGIDHIEIGTDHILFILALVLPSVLVLSPSKHWEPSPSFGSGLWRVLKIATMFTLAHSVTLTLGGLGFVEINLRFVETLIALSIAAAALHNIKPVFGNREWALAFGFGLFHGLGFASLLSDLGLDRTNRLTALLGFNVGVEIGQVVIILLVFPVLYVLRRTPHFLRVFQAASLALAAVACGWAVERGLDIDLRVNKVIDPILQWPRAFWILLALGVLAGVYQRYECRQGRLIPVGGGVPETISKTDSELVSIDDG